MLENKTLFSTVPDYMRPLFEGVTYPWELLPRLRGFVDSVTASGLEGFTEYAPGVLVGAGVTVADTATVIAPAVIGPNTEIRPGAYLRGYVITGEGCVIGNSSEVKSSVLLDRVQIPHYNYVGDSILGNRSHMGAGSICSNLKNDGTNVVVRGERDYSTELRKLGAILADGANVGCGCVLNPGTVIGRNSDVYPLTSLRGVVPADSIVKSSGNIVKKIK
ncbi:MAG: UDP-N-acetylglucosamine pyrophosphorylase [Clostridia bacterium]|nr:UDP-N-acetylglucosamine pyrophosphorylase [Clostridia bacterium]